MFTSASLTERRRRWARRLALALATVAALVLLRATLFAPEPIGVRVATVERGRVEETVTNSRAGTVRARRRARLSPEIGGRVAALPHREGDRVRRGELLLQIDAVLQQARLDVAGRETAAAGSERDRACLAAERAERERQRAQSLADDGVLSADLLDATTSAAQVARAACEVAAAARARAGAAEALARAELDKTRLRAPFDGVLAELSIEVGEWTTPSPPGIPIPTVLDLFDGATLYVGAPMDEVDSARIQVGQPARVTVDSHPGKSCAARVVKVAPYVLDVEAQNRTVEIELELEDAAFTATLLPGTSADVEVILDVKPDAIRVPTSALLEGGKLLVLERERLEERSVSVGVRNWDFTEIRTGLRAGERVVVAFERPEVRAGARARAEP